MAVRLQTQQDGRLQQSKTQQVTAATTLKPWVRRAEVDTTGGAFTLTLPPVSQMAEKSLAIYQIAGATNACTIADAGDSRNWSNITLNANDEHVLLYSDGFQWHETNVGYS